MTGPVGIANPAFGELLFQEPLRLVKLIEYAQRRCPGRTATTRRVLGALRELAVSWRLAYKTDEATGASVYGRGSSTYVSQPGSRDFKDSARPEQTLF